jgi:hypothetical protein
MRYSKTNMKQFVSVNGSIGEEGRRGKKKDGRGKKVEEYEKEGYKE